MLITKLARVNEMTQKAIKKTGLKKVLSGFGAMSMVGVLTLTFAFSPLAQASNYQKKIDALRAQNAETKQDVGELEDEATSLEDKINRLQARINSIQAQINDNEEKIADLKVQIRKAEKELQEQRNLLGENIRTMYLEGQISTLEMLASSKDLSEFVDKEQYRTAVQNKIKVTLDKINELKHELNDKKEGIEKRLSEQKNLRTELAAKRAENHSLLSLNESEQAQLDAQIRHRNKKIEELKRLQAIENMRLFGGGEGTIGGGGYPWGNARCIHNGSVSGYCPNYDWAVNGSVWNPNTGGYGYRNCTDWVSFRVRSTGRFAPGGLGNANTWDDRAPSYGFKVSGTPKAGAAAVSNGGFYGHVMYVEAVNGDGTIVISDYNRAGTGRYNTSTISASGLRFVYF
jgi:peptidoglycan DL-endopeptidase CwlO